MWKNRIHKDRNETNEYRSSLVDAYQRYEETFRLHLHGSNKAASSSDKVVHNRQHGVTTQCKASFTLSAEPSRTEPIRLGKQTYVMK